MRIYYENSIGEKIYLDEWPIAIDDITPLFEKAWKNETAENKMRNLSRLKRFYKTSLERQIVIQIFADNKEEYEDIMNRIEEVTEHDVLKKSPGRLYCGEYYLDCFATASSPKDYDELFYTIDIQMTITAFNPFWIKENSYTFTSHDISSTNDKQYPYSYSYFYPNGTNSTYLANPHFTDANFAIVMYGPMVNPSVTIGQNTYLVNITLDQGEYLEIHSRNETIYKVMNNGDRINAYHNRQKGQAFFKKIVPGRQYISWTGKFDLVIYEERSAPKWKLQ